MTIQHLVCNFMEVKAESNDGLMRFKGYGAIFGNVDSYGDVIQKGAFSESLEEWKKIGDWPAMLSQHGALGLTSEDLTPIGVYDYMAEDDKGLPLSGVLAETQRGTEMYTLMKMKPRPAIKGLSIGYEALEWIMGKSKNEPRRLLTKIRLWEVSPVTFAANKKASITSVKDALTIRDLESALRDVGLSQAEAKALLAGGYKALNQRDVDEVKGLDDVIAQLKRNSEILTTV